MQHSPANPRIERFTPLDEALARLTAIIEPVPPTEKAADDACGFVLAEDIFATSDLPATPTAYTDGWAVNAEELVGATAYSTAILAPPPPWVEADDEMPQGTDAVLPPLSVTIAAPGMAEASEPIAPGEGTRNTGADIEEGQLIAAAGTRLAARHVGILRASGFATVKIRAPRVRLVIASAAVERHSGMVQLWLDEVGATLAETVFADSREQLAESYHAPGADLVLSLGGTGQGRTDGAIVALKDAGSLDLHGIAVRPGGGTAFGRVEGVPVLLLPGRLDALIASWLAIGSRTVAELAGLNRVAWRASAPVTDKVTSIVGFAEIFLALPAEEGVRPVPLEESGFDALAQAIGWFTVPPESEGFAAGHTVQVRPFSPR